MKTLGIVVIVFGVLMFLSGINLAVTEYDLSSSHDISVCVGGFAFATIVLAGGIALFKRGNTSKKE